MKKYFYLAETAHISYDGAKMDFSRIFTSLNQARKWAKVNTYPKCFGDGVVYRIPLEKRPLFIEEGGHVTSKPKGWEKIIEQVY
jgi:hypothetical protein